MSEKPPIWCPHEKRMRTDCEKCNAEMEYAEAADRERREVKVPFRSLPEATEFDSEAVRLLIHAANGARFALHAELLSAQSADDIEGLEVLGEAMVELTAALAGVYGDEPLPPICSGCSPLTLERHGFDERRAAGVTIKLIPVDEGDG